MRERRSIDQASQSRPAPPDALTATKRRPAPAPSKQAHAAPARPPGAMSSIGRRTGRPRQNGRRRRESIIGVWWDDDVLLVVVGYGVPVPDHWTCRPTVPRRRRPPPQHPSPVVLWACVCRAASRRGERRNGNGSVSVGPFLRWRASRSSSAVGESEREASPTLGAVRVRVCSSLLGRAPSNARDFIGAIRSIESTHSINQTGKRRPADRCRAASLLLRRLRLVESAL